MKSIPSFRIPSKMNALVLSEFNGNPLLQEVEVPIPEKGKVLIKIESSPVNPSDNSFIRGIYSTKKTLPVIPGFEASGIVVATGDDFMSKRLLGKAVAYCLNQWHRISAYVKSGIVKPDNNDVENAIRPFAVGRKNWLFNSTPEGAAASATLYSLIETAKSNDLEPSAYLSYLFENLPKAKSLADFKSLMPQYLDKSKL